MCYGNYFVKFYFVNFDFIFDFILNIKYYDTLYYGII